MNALACHRRPLRRRARSAVTLGAAAVLLALPVVAGASDGFSCGNRVITTGMTAGEVVAACGDPAEVRVSTVLRHPTVWRYGRPWVVGEAIPIPVETWIYNFGPQRLMRKLRFDDGELVDIDTLGYGYYP